jgi:hypothetical protein
LEKVLLAAFWDTKAILLHEFLDHVAKINVDHNCTILWHLKEVIKMTHIGFLREKMDPPPQPCPFNAVKQLLDLLPVFLGMFCPSILYLVNSSSKCH